MVIGLSLVASVGFLNTSIALTTQDFGSSDIVEINSLVSDANVNFVFDFQTNTITHCNILTLDTLLEGNKMRCQLLDESNNKITQGTMTTDGLTNSYLIQLNQPVSIDDVEAVKVFLIGNSNNGNSNDTNFSSDSTTNDSSDSDGLIEICHVEGNSQTTKYVTAQSLSGHLGHGDYLGPCV